MASSFSTWRGPFTEVCVIGIPWMQTHRYWGTFRPSHFSEPMPPVGKEICRFSYLHHWSWNSRLLLPHTHLFHPVIDVVQDGRRHTRFQTCHAFCLFPDRQTNPQCLALLPLSVTFVFPPRCGQLPCGSSIVAISFSIKPWFIPLFFSKIILRLQVNPSDGNPLMFQISRRQ